MRLIALTGLARSGKNTVAEMIRADLRTYGHWVKELGFADPMKNFCKEVFGFDHEQLYGDSRERPDSRWSRPDGSPLTARFALQTLGTDWGRACDPNIWVKVALNTVRKLAKSSNPNGAVVITDCRFLNEARAIREAGGEVWRIRRDVPQLPHASEKDIWSPEMNEFVSAEIDNTERLEVTRAHVSRLIRRAQ